MNHKIPQKHVYVFFFQRYCRGTKREWQDLESARRSWENRLAALAGLHDKNGELGTIAQRMAKLSASLHVTSLGQKDKLDLARPSFRALGAAYDHPKIKADAL